MGQRKSLCGLRMLCFLFRKDIQFRKSHNGYVYSQEIWCNENRLADESQWCWGTGDLADSLWTQRLKSKCVLSQPKQGRYFRSREMGPNTGQTHLDISMVVSLVSEELEGLASLTRSERPSEHSLAYGAGRVSMAAWACKCVWINNCD